MMAMLIPAQEILRVEIPPEMRIRIQIKIAAVKILQEIATVKMAIRLHRLRLKIPQVHRKPAVLPAEAAQAKSWSRKSL
jgi:hypothetical protein